MKPVFSSRDFQEKKRFWSKIRVFFVSVWEQHITTFTTSRRHKEHQKTSPLVHDITPRSRERITKKRFTNPFMAFFAHIKHRRAKKTAQNAPHGRWKKVWSFCWKAGLTLTIIVLITLIGVFIYFSKDLPEPGKVNTRFIEESTKIYDRTGEILLYDIHGEEKRTIIPFENMPTSIKDATISLEDRDFYHHHGIRPMAIFRALLSQAFHIGTPSGGSTITQQLVKNSILTNERSLTRKIKEAILAIEIELKFTKDEILGMYLNEIPYGSNAYGVEAAAQTFFNKNARDLTVDEAGLLAALPQAPSRYSPYGSHRDLLKGRQEYAIDQMAALGYISTEDAGQYKNVDIFAKIARNKENIKAPHFVFYVREQLEELYGEDYLETNGLKVVTTLDWKKQQIAKRLVKEYALENQKKYNAENAALVAIDPQTGEILTMVGSRDYFDEEIDGNVNVAIAERQPGSSFKPYAYLLSFVKGYTPETILFDVETDFPILDQNKDYTPQNYDGTFHGPLKMKEALGMSLNIPAVKTLYLVGLKDAITFAKNLGITTLNDPDRYGLALVLGGGEVKLVDHVAAFSVFADRGVKHEKFAIKEIYDKSGEKVLDHKIDDGERIVEEKYVAMLSHVLSTNTYRAPAFGANNPLRFDSRPVAAKTGTTNENRDAWTVGYTPDVAVGVWAGNNDNRQMNSGGVGANAAAPLFRDFILEAYPEPSDAEFPSYDKDDGKTNKDILDGKIDEEKNENVCLISSKKNTYCIANKYCPDERKKKRTIINTHTILYYVQKDDPRGDSPKDPEDDPYFKPWEKGVEKYYKKNDDKTIFGGDVKECTRDDFNDYTPEIKISSFDVKDGTLVIKIDTDTPFDTESITYSINGKTVHTSKDKSYAYTIPDNQKNSTLTVRIELKDVVGNTVSDERQQKISITEPEPQPTL